MVLVAMADVAGNSGKSFSSLTTILSTTGHTKEDTVAEAQKKLEKAGLIKDTGQRVGKTGKIKVFQLPPEACIEKPNPSPNGSLPPAESPGNNPVITRSTGSPKEEELGTRRGSTLPTLEEVKAYNKTLNGKPIEAEKFFDHFTSNGWKVSGKAPMKDWKAALRNWNRKAVEFSGGAKNGGGGQWGKICP